MKDQELDKIEPIRMGNKLLYPIDSEISEIFENGDLTAQLMIKDNRLVIQGPKLRLDPGHKDQLGTEISLE